MQTRHLLCSVALIALAACSEAPDPQQVEESSVRAAAELARAKQAMPGRVHYDEACATCHEGAVKKAPHREMLGLMTPEAILASLSTGIMRDAAAGLDETARVAVAEYLAGSVMGTAVDEIAACDADAPAIDLGPAPSTAPWGIQHTNTRFVDEATAGLTLENIASLEPKLAFKFTGANRARSQPALSGRTIIVGSHGGKVYALDAESGCAHWSFQASGEVRTGIVASLPPSGAGTAYFGDVLANVYALDASSGELIWRERADDHPNATITGTPTLYQQHLYVPVSSLEVSLAVNPSYECCTFRGSVVAYDATTGARAWQTYTIDEPAVVQSQNRAGTNMRGPSGAVVWNSPAIDVERAQLYVATGENMSSPATATSDAVFAIALDDGSVNWVFQATENDVWNTACDTDTDHSCPPEGGPDFDFGAATMLVAASDGREMVIAGQKSGIVHALDPDDGSLVWQSRVGRGGIQGGVHFGMAASADTLFVPVSDMADGRTYDQPARPGLHALDIDTGEPKWYSPAPDVCDGRNFCHPGISQAITVAGDLVYAGGMDGVLRVHDTETGEVVWQLDTTETFTTVAGSTTTGGSFGGAAGPIVRDHELILSSGYGLYNHMAGNLLLVLKSQR